MPKKSKETNIKRHIWGKEYSSLPELDLLAVQRASYQSFLDKQIGEILQEVSPIDDFTLVQIIAGIAAVIGHIWTVFAGFRGGKGIATALGMLIMIITVDMLVALGIFIIVVSISRYVSLGSILAALSIPFTLIFRENILHDHIQSYGTILPFVAAVSLLVVYTHRKNVMRLINGTESKISFKKKK